MLAPAGAQYHIVKNAGWLDDPERDWLPEFDDGEDVYFRLEDNQLFIYHKYKWVPKQNNLDDLEIYRWSDLGPKLKHVIPTEKMAEATVRIAAILREMDIDQCRYNESLNALQYAIARNYLEEWASQPSASQSGTYQYWQDAHQRAGIVRPSG